MKTLVIPILLLILSFSSSCQKQPFADRLITTFKEGAIHPEEIDWKNFELEVKESLDSSRVQGIEKALSLYGNKHTFYRYKGKALWGMVDDKYDIMKKRCIYPEKNTSLDDPIENIGYINIPSLLLLPELSKKERKSQATEYVQKIVDEIKKQDSEQLTGWIIDLRFNGGGNMWPMLLALRPFFTQETLGYFIKGNSATEWRHSKGDIVIGWSSQKQKYLNKDLDYELKSKNIKIAVLVGSRTSSSGEATAIALGSVKHMAYFGDDTSGYSTANMSIKMDEDEYLFLTTSVMADHNKKEYWGGLKVDKTTCNEKELLQKVLDWMRQ